MMTICVPAAREPGRVVLGHLQLSRAAKRAVEHERRLPVSSQHQANVGGREQPQRRQVHYSSAKGPGVALLGRFGLCVGCVGFFVVFLFVTKIALYHSCWPSLVNNLTLATKFVALAFRCATTKTFSTFGLGRRRTTRPRK